MSTSLQTLLDQGKYDQAKELIDSMFSGNSSSKGDTYVDLAAMYIGAMNDANAAYIDTLEDSIAALEMLRGHEKQTITNIKVQDVRAKLDQH